MKNILIPFLEEESARAVFNAGKTLAEYFKAHVDVVHLLQRPLPASAYAYPVAVSYLEESLEKLEAAVEELASDMRGQFEAYCQRDSIEITGRYDHRTDQGMTASWSVFDRILPEGFTPLGRLADLVVLARPNTDAPLYQAGLVEEILFQTGRPVLLVDDNMAMTSMPASILLAWDGSQEASNALHAGLPVMKQARTVHVITIGDTKANAEPPDAVASFLKMHGVHAESSHPAIDRALDLKDAFSDCITAKKPDLVVMGAFSHTRWREVILGGLTRHMLREGNVPVLMAH